MRAKIDEFLFVLIVGVVILVIALAFFASIPPGGIGIIVPVDNFSLGSVGFSGDNVISRNYGSFKVGEINTETIKSIPQIQVSSGYFGSKSEKQEIRILSAYVPLAKEAKITFNVYDSTPSYGNLIIKWNGMEVYKNGASRGQYSIRIDPKYIREINNLEVSADGPGLFFWAATTYILRDFKITLDYGNMKLIPFTMGSEEIETFKNGILEFSNPYNSQSKLTVKVNGEEVFSQKPGPSESVNFDLFNCAITPGNNLITLSVQGDPVQLDNVILKIFLSTQHNVRERKFAISPSNYSLFSQGYRGKIEFDVASITKQGSMYIKLNGNDIVVSSVQKGTNTAYFSEREAKEGENTIVFSGTGGWEVSDVRILLER
ncbi:MAG: hypothetical protein QXN71_03945 [Candidatus Aenigmatarchaeota archaeon]